jgi:hypothetical protein
MIQAFSHIFNFFNIASPCGDMDTIAEQKKLHLEDFCRGPSSKKNPK